jgi:hypothetical protein
MSERMPADGTTLPLTARDFGTSRGQLFVNAIRIAGGGESPASSRVAGAYEGPQLDFEQQHHGRERKVIEEMILLLRGLIAIRAGPRADVQRVALTELVSVHSRPLWIAHDTIVRFAGVAPRRSRLNN